MNEWKCPGLPGGRQCVTPEAEKMDRGPRVNYERLCVSCWKDALACAVAFAGVLATAEEWDMA